MELQYRPSNNLMVWELMQANENFTKIHIHMFTAWADYKREKFYSPFKIMM